MGTCLIIIGGLSFVDSAKGSWAIGSMLLLWNVFYQFSVSLHLASWFTEVNRNGRLRAILNPSQIGTIAFSLVTELSSRRLMIKTLNIGRAVYNVEGLVLGFFDPYMLSGFPAHVVLTRQSADARTDPTAWNWGAKTAFFWAGFDALCVIWIYYRLPDPTGMTFAEIDKVRLP